MTPHPTLHCCATCKRQLDQAGDPDTQNCGGDCLRCMAGFDDPDAVASMRALEPDNPRWKAQEGDHGPQPSNLAKVTEITAMTRRVFEQILTASDIAGMNGSCLYGSILLSQLLGKFGECEARVCGGDGQADGGAADPSGGWHGHYWVEGKTKAGLEFVADITADQFHWPPVVVLPAEQARYRYRPGGADKVAQDVREIEAEIDEQGARVLERGWGRL